MKHQQVSVDFWAMGKSMLMYGVLTVAGWMMLRLFNAVFSLPRRLRTQQRDIQATLAEFQRRYPDLNVTEEDLKDAEKEIEQWNKELQQKLKDEEANDEEKKESNPEATTTEAVEDKKCI